MLKNCKSESFKNNIHKKHNLACLVLIGIGVCYSMNVKAALPVSNNPESLQTYLTNSLTAAKL
jgi:hypothetical protein